MSDKPDFYDIVRRGTFFIDIQACEKIENITDSFISREDLELILGHDRIYDSRIYLGSEIRTALQEWGDTILPNACGTAVMTPRIDILCRETSPDLMRRYAPDEYTLRGNRIINKEARRERDNEINDENARRNEEKRAALEAAPYERSNNIMMRDFSMLKHTASDVIEKRYGVSYREDYYHRKDKISLCVFLKRLISWDDIAKQHRKHHKKKMYLQDLPFMKRIWDDPTLEP